jgi:hypothetical protein
MSSLSSDAEEQTKSPNACFQFIPSKNDHEQIQYNSNPESSFYCIKNAQESSFLSSTSSISRPGYARTLFTVIPPMLVDTVNNVNVRNQLSFFL